MAVILANTTLSARRKVHQYEKDSHGVSVASTEWGAPTEAFPGAVVVPPDGPTQNVPWRIRADVQLWPLYPDDELTTDDDRKFIVRTARLVQVPGYPDVDYIQVTGDLTPPYVP